LSLSPPERRRRALIAVLLAGFAPPGGHIYVGRPIRGIVLLLLSLAAGIAWVIVVPRSLHQSQAAGLAGALLVLAMLIDAAMLARRTPRILPPRRLHRWWIYATLILVTQLVLPDLLFRMLKSRAGLALQADRGMEPLILADERIVFERLPGTALAMRDRVVVFETDEGGLLLRRVAGLPGERIAVRSGIVTIDGMQWIEDRLRPRRRPDLHLDETLVGRDQVLVLGERRRKEDPVQGLVDLDRLRGRASWVLQPPGFPRDPQFGGRLGESLR
jgi:signal peptidase I